MHVPVLNEPCNAPPHWHCSFHVINRPQSGPELKDFMRLLAIGSAYTGSKKVEVRGESSENGSSLKSFPLFVFCSEFPIEPFWLLPVFRHSHLSLLPSAFSLLPCPRLVPFFLIQDFPAGSDQLDMQRHPTNCVSRAAQAGIVTTNDSLDAI